MPWTPPTDIVLSHGIRVVYDHVPMVDSCAIGIWVRAGTRDEPENAEGVAHVVEHAAFRRTGRKTTSRISRDFENVGAYANAFTTKEETCYEVRTLSEHIPSVLDTLTDVVLNPVFLDADIKKERSIISEEIRSYEDEAEELIFDLGEEQLFSGHGLGKPILGTINSISGMLPETVRSFHKQQYHAGSIVVAVSGRFDPDRLLKEVGRFTSAVRPKKAALKRPPPRVLAPKHIEIRKSVQQAHVLWQRRTVGYNRMERFAVQILNVILGDGMSSRLSVRLRESRGLAYSVYSQVQLFEDCGSLAIYAAVDEKSLTRVEQGIRHILDDLASGGITHAEHRRAVAQLRASKLMSLESLTARMTMLGKGIMEQGNPENPFDTISSIEQVTYDELCRVAARLCNPNKWSRCIILPSEDGA